MLKLFFDLKYQNITLTNPGVTVASDSKNYLVAKFNTISDDWEAPLSAIFVSTVDKVAYTVLVGQSANLAADECFVPWEVLRDSGEVYVSVFSGNLHTTNVAKFAVVKSGYVEGEIPPPPTPTVYEQILEELENKQDIIHLDNAVDVEFNPNGHYVLYYFDNQDIRHNIFDFSNLPSGSSDYEELENKPQIVVANSPTGWWETLTFNGKFKFKPFYFSNGQDPNGKNEIILDIKDNAITFNMLRDNNKFFYNYGLYSNPPSDLFTNWYTAPYENGIWYISNATLQGLPVAKAGKFINYYIHGVKLQLYIPDVDSSTIGHSQVFFRVSYGGILGTWQEITNQNVVSGVVNSDGTITFTNSDGTTFTTTGSSVIGFSPVATVTQTQSGATVSITDKNGTTTANISNGNDYVLTAQDKSDIADIVLSELPTTQGVLYGNTSN